MLVDVETQSVVGAFKRGRAKSRETHALMVQPLELKCIPTADDRDADASSRPSIEANTRVMPSAFIVLWTELDPFNVDLMACAVSTLRFSSSGEALPFLPVRPCQFLRDRRVCAGYFDREGYESPGLYILLSTP